MVLNEFFSALGSGRFLLAIICCGLGGIVVGGSTRSIGARFGWSLVVAFVVVGLLVTSEHVRGLVRAGETGALPSGFFSNFVMLTVSVCVAVYLGLLLMTVYGLAIEAAEERAAVEAMGPDDLVRELNVVAAHPALAHGWFGDRWKVMTDVQRRSWAQQNIEALRELRLLGREQGFAKHDLQLPVFLAEIDQLGRQ